MHPFFTVTISAWNCSAWIESTIDDVLKQTFQDYELIVVDDGSTDTTPDVIRSLIEKTGDSRIQYVSQPNSGSPASPRNHGLRLAKGQYISFLDHDDRWRPTRLEQVWKRLEAEPNLDVICHDENRVVENKIERVLVHGPDSPHLYLDMLVQGNRLSGSATTVRTELARKLGGFDERREFFTVEDYDFWLRLAENHARFYFLHEVLGDYTINGLNMTSHLEAHYTRRRKLLQTHLERNASLLAPYRGRILGLGDYAYARELHRARDFTGARRAYQKAWRQGYHSPKLWVGMGLAWLGARA